jgi:secreted trypsin-like serine protease
MQRPYRFLAAVFVLCGVVALLGFYLRLPAAVSLAAAPPEPVAPTPRIVGGEEAPVGAYPWMTALVANNAPPAAGQFCGGSLIHREWVLTAAHCVTAGSQVDAPGTIDIVVGLHQRSQDNGIRRDLQAIVVHPNWNASTMDYDVALLHLAQPIDGVALVTLAQAIDAPIFEPGDTSRVIGWGATAWQGSSSDVLLQVDLPIVDQQTCNDAYMGDITERMICAGFPQGGKDSCQGDSGGPLVVNDNSTWRQIGVVSWGHRCAEPNFPGIYARVSVLYDWVAQQAGLQPTNPTATPTFTPIPSDTPTATPTVTGTPPTPTPSPTATATFPARAFFPQISRQLPPTPTVTPTATSTPIPSSGSLINGDFEQGPGVGWTEFSALGYDLIMNSDFPGSIAPHSGQWAVWLGGVDNEISYVEQSVSVEAGASILGFWMWIASQDECGFDFGGVTVNGASAYQFELCDTADTNGWVRRTIDLGAYVGQSVTFQIRAETDASLYSDLIVDDVTLSNAATILLRPAPQRQPVSEDAALSKQPVSGVNNAASSAPEARLWTPLPDKKH